MSDTAATLQQEYDMAVIVHGADSRQAIEAEKVARQFFKGFPAPKTLATNGEIE